jgi:Brp/Blh family beta-carotene 15,15'-monooxygenase
VTAQVVALAVLVAVVGMPHGGLDHRFGRAVLRPSLGRVWPATFLAGYLVVMVGVLAGWWFLPLPTVVGFVVLSAVHFGSAEVEPGSPGGLARAALLGGMVVWMPALVQPVEFTRLLTWVVPRNRWPEHLLFDPAARACLGALLPVAVASAFATSARSGVRTVAFAVVFAIAPPLVSFALYFCGWHSAVELYRLARQAHPEQPAAGLARVVAEAAPLATLAVLMIAAGWWAGAADRSPTPWLVQTVFVGLSAAAVPHMLLHRAAARRGVNPFAEAAP